VLDWEAEGCDISIILGDELDAQIAFAEKQYNIATSENIFRILRTMLLPNLALLVRIAEKGGLAAAGRDFGLSPATVSERLVSLEAHYGAKLINRTTRSISLTDEGRLLVEGARRLLSDAEDLKSLVRNGVDRVSGLIRISAPFDLGRHRIAPLLDGFLEEHPDIEVDLLLADGYVDIVGQGIDLAVRYGALKDSQLVAHRLGEHRRIVCAAPKYLERYGVPSHPKDLGDHNCLIMRFGNSFDSEWSFREAGKDFSVLVKGNRTSNDGALVRSWCLQGFGITLKSIWDIEHHLAKGELVALLPDYMPAPSSLQILYQGGRSMPKRNRLLIDHLSRHLTLNPRTEAKEGFRDTK
jgi:DNA-binding transcriptional LysR family regulator